MYELTRARAAASGRAAVARAVVAVGQRLQTSALRTHARQRLPCETATPKSCSILRRPSAAATWRRLPASSCGFVRSDLSRSSIGRASVVDESFASIRAGQVRLVVRAVSAQDRRPAKRSCSAIVDAVDGVSAQLRHLHLRRGRLDAATRRSTIVEQVQREFGCPVASHLTCVGSTVDELRDYLREAARARRREHRGPARRSAAGRNAVQAPSPADCRTPTSWWRSIRGEFPAVRHRRGRLSRNASRSAQPRGRPGEPAPQSRRRRPTS